MSPETAERVYELTRALQAALDLSVVHLCAAIEAEPNSAARGELVLLARDELAIALTMLTLRRPLLDLPGTAHADHHLLHAIAKLHDIANGMDGPQPS